MNDNCFSRERAAGYDPDRLATARIAVIGAGALGQNILLNLALAQVGEVRIVDDDAFESHNATRSPFYPTLRDCEQWGKDKAAVVAHKCRQMISWSETPAFLYYVGRVQGLGDSLFQDASLVISAVDNDDARAYLAAMTRKHRLPLIEGGFDGADISFAAFRNAPSDPCWCCPVGELRPVVRFSCTAHASEVEAAGFIPATQTAAAALGALMAEAAIQVLHGNLDRTNCRTYLHIRTVKATTVRLAVNADCAGRHEPAPDTAVFLETPSSALARILLDELASKGLADPMVELPDRFVLRAPCAGTGCTASVDIGRPLWELEAQPRCQACGGRWQRSEATALPLEIYAILSPATVAIHDLPCSALGIAAGALLDVSDRRGRTLLARLPGSTRDLFRSVSL